MSQQETPLLGGENTPMIGGTGFDGLTPKQQVVATPNTVIAGTPYMTPRNALTDGEFPPKQSLSILFFK